MLEQRKSIRRRTLLDGRLKIERLNGWTLDCCVRNVSEDGARIALRSEAAIPQSFDLGISGADPRPARLVWYANGQAGVTFGPQSPSVVPVAHADRAAASARSDADILQARIVAITSRREADRGPRA